MTALENGKLTVTRERMWGQYRRPTEPVLVKLPADPQSKAKYLAKGFTFIKFGADDEIPMAILDTSSEQLAAIAPKAVIEPEISIASQSVVTDDPLPDSVATVTDEPELYVAEHPYKSKKKPKRKRQNTS
jgi:hypothetical protein